MRADERENTMRVAGITDCNLGYEHAPCRAMEASYVGFSRAYIEQLLIDEPQSLHFD
jgi:hypothetical protein